MKLVLIDDEEPARQLVKIFLKDHPDCEVVGEAGDGFEGFRLIKELNPDLVFLDIQMPRITGFEMLELLEEPPIIIFATAYDQFALKAFEKNAADYILKPFSRDRFNQALQKARERSQLRKANAEQPNPEKAVLADVQDKTEILDRIAVKLRNRVYVIPVDQIFHIEAEGDYVNLHTPDGCYLKEFTMKYLDAHLPPDQFLRVHRSDFVRLSAVQGLEHKSSDVWHVKLKNGSSVRCSSEGIKALKKKLGL